jgi:hypothetical protein
MSGAVNAQKLESSLEATEYLQTNDRFIYQNVHIPVLDISYHEFSADSLTWRKTYQNGDCYVRFANTTSNTTNPYTSKQGYHDTWWVYNFCTGTGTGTSQIDTIIYFNNGVRDTITDGTAVISIPTPITITGSTGNTQTDTTHTHEIVLRVGELQDVDTTGIADGQVLKYNATTGKYEAANDLIGGGASGQLTVKEQDGSPNVSNVVEIRVENGKLTNEGAGAVSIDFTLDPQDGTQDFFRTDTVSVSAGDTFLTFDTPMSANDYIVSAVYALYPNGERQNLTYDSTASDGFRVLDVIGESVVHYWTARNLDTLGLIASDYGRVAASGTDPTLGYLNAKTDDSTITVVNNKLHVVRLPNTMATYTSSDTISVGEDIVFIDATSTSVTVTLPTAVGNRGVVFNIKCIDDTNACYVDPDGTETMDGSASSFRLFENEAITIVSDGTAWYIY